MKINLKKINRPVKINQKKFFDQRGYFQEIFLKKYFNLDIKFTALAKSKKNVIRGLHFQNPPYAQGKLVWVSLGSVLDIALDIRIGSPTFGKYASFMLDDKDHQRLYIPKGFAHGFCVLSQEAIFQYMCTEVYHPEDEYGVLWNDPEISINWPNGEKIVSDRDTKWPNLNEIDPKKLPKY